MLISVSIVTVIINSVCFIRSGFGAPLYVAKLENKHFRSYAYIAFKIGKDVGVTKQSDRFFIGGFPAQKKPKKN